MTLQLTPPTAAYVTVVLTTLAALELGNHSSCYGSSSSDSGSGTNSRCLYFHRCVQCLADYERLISGGNISFSNVELEDACHKYDDITMCVRRAKMSCVFGPPASGKTAASGASSDNTIAAIDAETKEIYHMWNGLNASMRYLCNDVRPAVVQYSKACYSQPPFVSSIRKCNKTFLMEKEAQNDKDLCRLTKTFLDCLHEKTLLHCQDAVAAEILTTAVQLLQQPRLDVRPDTPCLLGGAGVVRPSSTIPLVSGLLLVIARLLVDV